MKSANKKVLSSVLAAAVVIGGAGWLHTSQAAAADSNSSSVTDSAQQKVRMGHHEGFRGELGKHAGIGKVDLLKLTAGILSVDESTITSQLQDGKTWADIVTAAGISAEDYLAKLTAAQSAVIDEAVTAGKLTQEQADKLKSNLSDMLKKQIEHTYKSKDGNKDGSNGFGKHPGKKGMEFMHNGFVSNADLASILGMTEDELAALKKEGKSLAEIAEAKNISKEQLTAKIKESLSSKLDTIIENRITRHPGEGKSKAAAPSASSTDSES